MSGLSRGSWFVQTAQCCSRGGSYQTAKWRHQTVRFLYGPRLPGFGTASSIIATMFGQPPGLAGDASGHGRGHAQRLVDAGEVVEDEVDGVGVVLRVLAEGVGQPREPPDGQIISKKKTRPAGPSGSEARKGRLGCLQPVLILPPLFVEFVNSLGGSNRPSNEVENQRIFLVPHRLDLDQVEQA